LEPAGKEYSAVELAEEVLKDREFYYPDGGVTLSGGEPFSQAGFLIEFLIILRREKIHITAETSGYFNWEVLKQVLSMVDLLLFDLKALDERLHQTLTGKDNKLILKNLVKVIELKIPHQIRMPLVPGMNDADDEIKSIAKFLLGLGEKEIWLLSYHRLGEGKLKKLNTELRPLGLKSYSDQEFRAKAEIFANAGLIVRTFNFSIFQR